MLSQGVQLPHSFFCEGILFLMNEIEGNKY